MRFEVQGNSMSVSTFFPHWYHWYRYQNGLSCPLDQWWVEVQRHPEHGLILPCHRQINEPGKRIALGGKREKREKVLIRTCNEGVECETCSQ